MPIEHSSLTRKQLEFYLGETVSFINIALKSDNIEEIKRILRNILSNIEPSKEEH